MKLLEIELSMKKIFGSNVFKLALALFIPFFLLFLLFWKINGQLHNGFIVFIDQSLLISKNSTLHSLFSLWSHDNLGYISSIRIPLNFPSKTLSWLLFRLIPETKDVYLVFFFLTSYLIYLSSFFSFYKIQQNLFKKNNYLFPALCAFFYAFNFSSITNTGTLDSNFHVLTLAPIILYLLIIQINGTKGLKYLLLEILLISAIINNIPFALGFLITMYLSYFIFKLEENFPQTFIKYFFLTISVLFLSSYFIYSYFYAYKNIVAGAFYTVVSNGGAIFLNNGVKGLFQLIYDWTTQIYYFPRVPHQYFHYYLGIVGIISSYLIWMVIIYAIIVSWHKINKNKILFFLLSALLLSFFIIKGDQSPFGYVNLFMYKVNPIMNVLRTPSSKFSLPIMLYLSVLILFVLNYLKNNFVNLLVFVLIVFHTLFFFNPMRFIGYRTINTDKSVGHLTKNYLNISKILNSSNKKGAVFMYPSDSAGFFKTNNQTFFSQDILSKLIDRPVIHSDDPDMKNAKPSIDKIPKSFDPGFIGSLSIRYIVLRHDFDVAHLKEPMNISKIEEIITNNGAFKKIYSDDELKLYEISEKYFNDIIRVNSVSKSIDVSYQTISAYHYKIKIKNIPNETFQIIFNNSYDQEWNLKSTDKEFSIVKIMNKNTFGNKWQIKKNKNKINKNLDKVFEIYYAPQKNLFTFLVISVSSYLILFALLVKFWKRN